ncbi:lysylphosphatidylglycerol synthase transmembrane domain-containing protein [Iamia majanohamensis]|uniref:Lysylphosphatidylglycerol synthase transmembrane domain-containing protein n=1 Tax=Iamia majanohamensis TaxID=467976 RepID=A0AAE9Y487_9ACTN|nr:lysylphosphatidylglycerol synthase transmembrane domain-containing protein [Iamia majanohamensis]WCO65959.1 lysylphosphatidylglycerol synthase transmembrane domain-containing protein [Iamia majanohamensis]
MDDAAAGTTDPAPPPRREKARRRAVLVVRIAVSAGMLWFLLDKISDSSADALPEWTTATALWLSGAVLLTLASIVLSAVRWQTVLAAMGRPAALPRLLSHYLAGQFVANVLPTTIGGDVLRVSRLAQDNGKVHDSFASVVLERLTGWLVLPLITFIGLIINPPLQHLGEATQIAFGLACATLVALVLVVGAVAAKRWGDMEATKGWKRFLAAVSLGLNALRTHPRQAISVVAVGFAYQLVLVAAAVMAARALGIPDAGPTALLAFFPAIAIAQVLPISISGLGVREGLFVLFLRPLGVPTGQAVALGILLYLLNLIVSLLGAPAFAIGGRRRLDGGPVGPEDEDAPLRPDDAAPARP